MAGPVRYTVEFPSNGGGRTLITTAHLSLQNLVTDKKYFR